MTKKFVNLPKNYKNLLNNIKKILNKEIILKLVNENINFREISNLHNNIEQLCENENLNSYDLNKLINYYDKKNTVIEILRKIASVRNKFIVKYAYKNDLWKQNLNNIKNKINIIKGKNINTNIIEKGYIKLLKKYKYDWDGLWSMIDFDKRGNIKSIGIFDTDDFETLIEYLN